MNDFYAWFQYSVAIVFMIGIATLVSIAVGSVIYFLVSMIRYALKQ